MENTIITPEALAKRWSISLSTVARWRSEGIGPVFLKLRGQVRYRLEDIESYEIQTLQIATDDMVSHVARRDMRPGNANRHETRYADKDQ